MIYFSDNLFCTDKIKPDINRIKLRLYSGIGTVGTCFITISDNANDVFDIYPASLLKQRPFRKRDHYIIGLAESKRAAIRLTGDMIAGAIEEKGDATDLKNFFLGKVKW